MGDARMYAILCRTYQASLSGRGIYHGNWEIKEFYASKDEARDAYAEHIKKLPPVGVTRCQYKEYKVISVDTHEL
jgi:hypothetical protein